MDVLTIIIILAVILAAIAIAFVLFRNNNVERFQSESSLDPKLKKLRVILAPMFDPRRNQFTDVLEPLNGRNLLDEVELYTGNQSYTINKHKIYMCLKDENGKYYDDNTLLNVLIHELAHCVSNQVGHTALFGNILEHLMARAAERGIIDPNKPVPQNYCPPKK